MSLLKGKNNPELDEPEIDDSPGLDEYEQRQKEVYKQALIEAQEERDRKNMRAAAPLVLLLGIAIALVFVLDPTLTAKLITWLNGLLRYIPGL